MCSGPRWSTSPAPCSSITTASSFRIEEHETAENLSFFCFGSHPEAWDFVAAYGKEHLLTPPEGYLIELIGSLY